MSYSAFVNGMLRSVNKCGLYLKRASEVFFIDAIFFRKLGAAGVGADTAHSGVYTSIWSIEEMLQENKMMLGMMVLVAKVVVHQIVINLVILLKN